MSASWLIFDKGRVIGLVWPFPTAPAEKPGVPKSRNDGTTSIGPRARGSGIGLAFTKSGSASLPLPRAVNEVNSPWLITTPCERESAGPAPEIEANKISETQIRVTERVIRSAEAPFG